MDLKTTHPMAPGEIIDSGASQSDFLTPELLENMILEVAEELLGGKVKSHVKRSPKGKPFVVREHLRKDPPKGFISTDKNQKGKSREGLPSHIKGLAIPPAWTDVAYNPDPNGKLYVIGYDKSGKQQRLYNKIFRAKQEKAKHARVKELAQKYELIMREVKEDIRKGVNKEEASCLRLIMMTGIRPGGTTKAVGATTLLGKHVFESANGEALYLRFVGKSRQKNSWRIDDPELVNDIVERVWANKDHWNSPIFHTSYQKLLAYSKSKDGGGFTSKEYRTLIGTSAAIQEIKKMKAPTTPAEYKKAVNAVAKKVAEKLNNTPTVAKNSYINPSVWAKWRSKAGV